MASSTSVFLKSLVVAGAVSAGFYFAAGPGILDGKFAPSEAAAQSEDHPAVTFRQAIFQNLKWHIGKLGAMAKGEMDYDEAAAKDHANVIAVLAGTIPQGFPEGSESPNSAALPAIWEDFSSFEERAGDLQAAAAALAEAGDVAQGDLGGYVKEIGGACGACHDDFREKN